jgi:hypothetical protein
MKNIKSFESLMENINESVTDHYVINSKDKKIYSSKGNSRSYWQGDKKGTIDMEIDVFSSGGNSKKHAKEIYNALKAAGLENKYFFISVNVK